jgi:hypothetical protein
MKRIHITVAAVVIPVLITITSAHGSSGLNFFTTPRPFISQPPFIPITDFSAQTYHVTVSGIYGYEKYSLQIPNSFPLHRGGFQIAASGAFTEALGWNIAMGLSFPAMVSKYVSIRLGSCVVPVSASLAWRFAGGPDRSNLAMIAGVTYTYSAIRGYYRTYVWGPPYLFYVIKVVALADVPGSIYGVFAGIRPMLCVTDRVSLRPFAAYRITFDTSGFYYHVRLKLLNDELPQSGPFAFKFRQTRETQKPIHEILIGIEVNMYGVGVHGVAQFSPASSRIMYQLGLSYTHAFTVKK